jgi:periplasmic protein TonB
MTRDADKTTPFVKDDHQPRGGKGGQKPPRGGPAPDPYRDQPAKAASALGPMFGNFAAAKKRKLQRWAVPLLSAMLLFHVVLFLTMWVKTIWDIEQLDRPKNAGELAIAAPPPPPPPPPKGGVKPKDVTITPKKIKVRDIVQPVKIEQKEVAAPVETGDPNGVEGGEEGGTVGGEITGVVAAPPPPPPPPPPAPPATVAPTALDANRISGEKLIVPDDVTKTEISRSGKDKLVGTYKLCITLDGNISSVTQLKSTGFGAYDSKIQNTIRGEWRYRPFMVNGKAAPVCTAVTFIYSQK